MFRRLVFYENATLSRIHSNAFTSITKSIVSISFLNSTQFGNNSDNVRELFNALNNLTNIEQFAIANSDIKSIPANALKTNFGDTKAINRNLRNLFKYYNS